MSNGDDGKWFVILILGFVFIVLSALVASHWADQYGKCHCIQCAPCVCKCDG